MRVAISADRTICVLISLAWLTSLTTKRIASLARSTISELTSIRSPNSTCDNGRVLVSIALCMKKAYEDLLAEIDAPPVSVLYASDGGKAEKIAKWLAAHAKMRGLSASMAPMDGVKLEELRREDWAVFITSVAGQDEFPQNGRVFMKALNAAVAISAGQCPLANVKYSVFGMGDSHYWPRPEDKHFYSKAGKDLDVRLESLGAQHIVPIGLGDDQDADGPETGYKQWEPLIWKALGVDSVEVQEAEPEPITNEHI